MGKISLNDLGTPIIAITKPYDNEMQKYIKIYFSNMIVTYNETEEFGYSI